MGGTISAAHLHLIVNHAPVILAPLGLVILVLGMLRRNVEFSKVGLGVLVAAAPVASVWLGVTANLGGQIRYAEIQAARAES
jgi:hypothetical protein